jgi:probable HAF family extracellular repeat protein
MLDLGSLGGTFEGANTMNDAGTGIGGGTLAGDQVFHAFIWEHGVMTDLGTVGGNDCSNAFGINAKDQVVGDAFPCNVNAIPHPFLWEKGDIIDLNVFVPAGSDLTLVGAEEINDHGEIFGIGTLSNGDARAFLLIPVGDGDPEGISATPENLAALAAKTGQISVSATQSRKVPRDMAAVWRSRFTGRYHLPSLGTPKD